MSANASPSDKAARSAVSVALLLFLLVSAGVALLGQPRVIVAVRNDTLSPEWLLVAPVVFAFAIVMIAADTVLRARRRGFVSGRALAQLAFAVAFTGFLLPQAWTEYRARKAPAPDSIQLLRDLSVSRDPRVRAVVMDLAGFRGEDVEVAPMLAAGLDDKDPMVREAAYAAVERREGSPLGEGQLERARSIVQGWGAATGPKSPAP